MLSLIARFWSYTTGMGTLGGAYEDRDCVGQVAHESHRSRQGDVKVSVGLA